MAVTTREMDVLCSAVWEVIKDGFSYADWVVGTSAIRAVDDGFPEPGKRLHYRIGWGPVRFQDTTKVQAVEPGRSITLVARGRPVGDVWIRIDTEDMGAVTRVSIDEKPVTGLAKVLHTPISDLMLKGRNVETLRRLERLAKLRLDPSLGEQSEVSDPA